MKRYACRAAVVAMLSLAAAACGANDSDSVSAGVWASESATAADTGLPAYPGAKPYQDTGDGSPAANVGIDTPLFGLKVVAMKLETADTPQQVAAFYRKALARYGEVLDCSDATHVRKGADDDELHCDANEPGDHDIVYKVGTEKKQRIVAIKEHGRGARFSLVHLAMRGQSRK